MDPFGRDKGMHFAIGLSVGAGSHALVSSWLPSADPLAVSIGATVLGATGKEFADALGFGTPDWWDFAWTLAGGLIGAAVSWGAQVVLGG